MALSLAMAGFGTGCARIGYETLHDPESVPLVTTSSTDLEAGAPPESPVGPSPAQPDACAEAGASCTCTDSRCTELDDGDAGTAPPPCSGAGCSCNDDPLCQGASGALCAGPSTVATCARGSDGCLYVAASSACTLGGLCQSGACQPVTIATSQARPAGGITVDANNVYWADLNGGTVAKVSVNGGAIALLATGQNSPRYVALDTINVYWTTRGTSAANYRDGTVMSVPLAGGNPIVLASGQNAVGAITVDAANVYWTTNGTSANGFNDGTVMALAKR